MSNTIFGWPLFSDVGVTYTPALSGGSWLAALPLTNVQDRRLARVARSADAAAASTTLTVDLGVARAVRVLSVLAPNLTKSAVPTLRWEGNSAAGFGGGTVVYDSTALACWPTGLTAEGAAGLNVWLTTVPTSDQTARYWRCSIVDTANVDGYLDLARLVIAGGFQPTINMQYGHGLGLESESTRELTEGGAAIYGDRPRRRTATFTIPNLPESEALASAYQMQRLLGTTGQLFFVFDPTDTTYLHVRSFLAVLRELSPMEQASLARYGVPFSLTEEL